MSLDVSAKFVKGIYMLFIQYSLSGARKTTPRHYLFLSGFLRHISCYELLFLACSTDILTCDVCVLSSQLFDTQQSAVAC